MNTEWKSIETDPPTLRQVGEFTDGVFRVLGRVDLFDKGLVVRPYRAEALPLSEFSYWREMDELPEEVKESFFVRHPEARELNPPGTTNPFGVVLVRRLSKEQP